MLVLHNRPSRFPSLSCEFEESPLLETSLWNFSLFHTLLHIESLQLGWGVRKGNAVVDWMKLSQVSDHFLCSLVRSTMP